MPSARWLIWPFTRTGACKNKRHRETPGDFRQIFRADYIHTIQSGLCPQHPGKPGRLLSGPPAKDYTVGMILRVTEGSLAPVDCLTGDDNPCARQQECVTLKLWKELDGAIRDVVDGYTLDDLVQWQRAMQDNYVI